MSKPPTTEYVTTVTVRFDLDETTFIDEAMEVAISAEDVVATFPDGSVIVNKEPGRVAVLIEFASQFAHRRGSHVPTPITEAIKECCLARMAMIQRRRGYPQKVTAVRIYPRGDQVGH